MSNGFIQCCDQRGVFADITFVAGIRNLVIAHHRLLEWQLNASQRRYDFEFRFGDYERAAAEEREALGGVPYRRA